MAETENSTNIGIVAAPHHLAARAGATILQQGGNAVDAAVAVSLAIGVAQPYHSGIGGGCTINYRLAGGTAQGAIDARGPAPRQLTRPLFFDENDAPDYQRVQTGPLASVLPSMVGGLHALHAAHGRLPWGQVCAGPQLLARDGFPADFMLANVYRHAHTRQKLEAYGGDSPLARPLREGELVVQPALANTLAALADDPRTIYEGAVAQQLVTHMQRTGGVWEPDDLATYQPTPLELRECTYRGWRVVAPGLPTIGAQQVLLILQMLEGFDLPALQPGSVEHLHLVAEALRVAYAARAALSSNAEGERIADPANARTLAANIRLDRALDFAQALPASDAGSCTSHFCVADADGNIVSQTQTIRSHFGSGVIDPTSGIVFNDSAGDFSLRPGDVTTQGIQYNGTYNLLEPGAQPASSQSPVIAWNPETGEVLAAGAAGGPKIVSATLQALINCIDFGMDARRSASAPRVHCHGPITEVESGVRVAAELAALGHQIEQVSQTGIMQMIRCVDGVWEGAADPRGPGAAATVVRTGDVTAVRSYGISYTT